MSLLDRMLATSTIKLSAPILESKVFGKKEMAPTPVPMINVALSGRVDGGLIPGLLTLAGPSKHFKTAFALMMAAAFQKKYSDGVVLFYDSEFGSPLSYFDSFDVDMTRVLHSPLTNIEELKFDVMKQLESFTKKDNVLILIDSIGNLASKKEVDDALDGKSVSDMTRAKQLKGLFRMITPHLNLKDIPMVVVNHTYKTLELYSKDVVGGGCVVEGTMIQTPDGLVAVQELKVGDVVLTRDGVDTVERVWNPETLVEGTPECIEVEFDDGFKVVCSEDHLFLVGDNWVPAKDLVVGVQCLTNNMSTLKVTNITRVGRLPVYDISVAAKDYDQQNYVLENGAVTHNTGSYYSSDAIWIIGRQQEKTGKDVTGYHFVINIEKSRHVREKSSIPITVTYDGGISKWSGLLDVGVEGGYIRKPKSGWYEPINPATGELMSDKLWRAKEVESSSAFWLKMFEETDFAEYISKRYTVGSGSVMRDDDDSAASQMDDDDDLNEE